MKAKPVIFSVRMPGEIRDALAVHAARRGDSISSVLRDISRRFLADADLSVGSRGVHQSVRPLDHADK